MENNLRNVLIENNIILSNDDINQLLDLSKKDCRSLIENCITLILNSSPYYQEKGLNKKIADILLSAN